MVPLASGNIENWVLDLHLLHSLQAVSPWTYVYVVDVEGVALYHSVCRVGLDTNKIHLAA
jgi:hypothetical protein